MKIVWTEPAVEDLREVHSYIARDSELYASEFISRIMSAVQRLAEHSKLGRIVPEANEEMFGSSSIGIIESFIE